MVCILSLLYFVTFAFCLIYILSNLHYVTDSCATILVCITLWHEVVYCNFHKGGQVSWMGLRLWVITLECMHHHSVWKWNYIMRFEIKSSILKISRKEYQISNLIIYFHFPQDCMCIYTMHALVHSWSAKFTQHGDDGCLDSV